MLYPVLIIASGLWYRTRAVWLATILCVLSNLLIWLKASWFHPERAEELHVHLVFVIALILIGLLVSLGVRQTRILQRHSRERAIGVSA